MRINKFIANSGYCSRRKADEIILAGKVYVNRVQVKELGLKIKDSDIVEIDGKRLIIEENFYIKLYKPLGFITSNFDPFNDKDLNNLLDLDKRFFAAGRLDKDSEGLLIITNDGDFTNKLIHPSFKLDKEYIVEINRNLKREEIKKFESGIDIGNGEITSDSKLDFLEDKTYRVIIHQGYNRQIRRMFKKLNADVLSLKRIRIGNIKISKLRPKEYRYFDQEEMKFVRKIKG